MPQFIDRSGKRYGRWLVLRLHKKAKEYGQNTVWLCRCDCGKEKIVSTSSLGFGSSKSCGCIQKEWARSLKGKSKLAKGEAAFNALLASYIKGAQGRRLSFELTRDQFRKLASSPCHYCGGFASRPYHQKGCLGAFYGNGIDRKNNKVGYTVENSVSCCMTCNFAKRNMEYADFISYLDLLVAYRRTL